MEVMYYALGLALGLLPAAVIGVVIHLVIRNPRVRTVTQAGCFALLLAPGILVAGHGAAIVPAWFVIYSLVSDPQSEMSESSELLWQALFAIVPTLVTWAILLGPVGRFNRRLSGSS